MLINSINSDSTICALATAMGGAIGIIRVSGNRTIEIVNSIFTKNLNEAKPNTVHYGHIINEQGKIIDEVLISIFHAPHSYTARILRKYLVTVHNTFLVQFLNY